MRWLEAAITAQSLCLPPSPRSSPASPRTRHHLQPDLCQPPYFGLANFHVEDVRPERQRYSNRRYSNRGRCPIACHCVRVYQQLRIEAHRLQASNRAVNQVIDIAQAHPEFPILLQWTGGRGSGHHSYEDFHAPILSMYSAMRKCNNLILVAGSGFGGSDDTHLYLTRTWSQKLFGGMTPLMPFDGVLLGSRMMVAREAHILRYKQKS